DNAGLTANSAPVTVTVNYAPSVSITNPLVGTTFVRPTNILIQATASDVETNGSVTKVEFFAGTTLLGTDTNAPFSITWSNVPAGSYTLFARATDNQGATANSAGVPIIVYETNAPPLVDPGPSQTNRINNPVYLAGTVSDDG